jgi:hypothetical protein
MLWDSRTKMCSQCERHREEKINHLLFCYYFCCCCFCCVVVVLLLGFTRSSVSNSLSGLVSVSILAWTTTTTTWLRASSTWTSAGSNLDGDGTAIKFLTIKTLLGSSSSLNSGEGDETISTGATIVRVTDNTSLNQRSIISSELAEMSLELIISHSPSEVGHVQTSALRHGIDSFVIVRHNEMKNEKKKSVFLENLPRGTKREQREQEKKKEKKKDFFFFFEQTHR